MITVEEKLNLFTKMVYDKIQRENKNEIDKYNKEFGSLFEEKRNEFMEEAAKLEKEGIKNIEKKKSQMISKAKLDEKKAILEKHRKIFEDAVASLIQYAKGFNGKQEYKDMMISDLKASLMDATSESEIKIYMTTSDIERFESEIRGFFKGNIDFESMDDIVGGFIVEDKKNNIKIDMTLDGKIESFSEMIGERIFAVIH